MKDRLQDLLPTAGQASDFVDHPLQLWHPPLQGEIPVFIDRQGVWYHDGGRIERESLVRLFASILRREDDGAYYLVTPVEKWRIDVELHALVVTDVEIIQPDGAHFIEATINTGRTYRVSEQYPLFLDSRMGGVAVLCLPHGLTALVSRPVWYRLMETAVIEQDSACLKSGAFTLSLPLYSV